MNITWFKNPDNLVYVNAEKDLAELEKQLQLPGLQGAAAALHAAPTAEGVQLKGLRRTSARLFIPDLVFDEHIEMGENLFLYLGEIVDCYVIFWPMASADEGTTK